MAVAAGRGDLRHLVLQRDRIEQPFELDAPVPAGDVGLLLGRAAEQRWIGPARFGVGGDGGVLGQHHLHVGAGIAQAPDQIGRFVRGDAAADAEQAAQSLK